MLDDFSRYILAWKPCTSMTATDVADTLRMALDAAGLERVGVQQRRRLLSDNGPSYVSAQLGSWLAHNGMAHARGKPYHPMTQGKIERYRRSMKNQDTVGALLLARLVGRASLNSSITTTPDVTMRASTSSSRPMFTAAAGKAS